MGVYAEVYVRVKVRTSDCYSDNETMRNIHESAANYARNKVKRLIENSGNMQVLANPEVTIVSAYK